MTERPILMSAPMVRATLDGSKTQTRRVAKITHQTPGLAACLLPPAGLPTRPGLAAELCPYGQPGDRLWVREAWQAELRWDWTPPRDIKPGSPIYFEFGDEAVPACAGRKRPSIHMPRWASRINLEITGVRVERLQDISDADAVAEGIGLNPSAVGVSMTFPQGESACHAAFRVLWESINGPESWAANPWVWVIDFQRIAP